jgi:type VI secretion system protein ImpK
MGVTGQFAHPRPGPARLAGKDERLLVDAFCEFHAEVVKLKRKVAEAPGLMTWDAVQQRLLDLFEEQAARLQAKLPDQHEARVFEETRYVMIAMADEVFIRLDWEGKGPWIDNPLEAAVFQSRESGERIFRKIQEALDRRASSQLLTVYLTALALGFRGKYAPLKTGEPETYRKKLADAIADLDKDLLADVPLCPDAYEHTAANAPKKGLPSFSWGLIPVLAVFVGWVVIGELLWLYRTAPVDDALDDMDTILLPEDTR